MTQSSVFTTNYRALSLPADISEPSFGMPAGDFSRLVRDEFFKRFIDKSLRQATTETERDLDVQLFDASAAFKMKTANVAMHLGREARDKLFVQLDSLLDTEEWNPDDRVPTVESFDTFLKLMFVLPMPRRPSIGATHDGHLLAAWKVDDRLLSIECSPNDRLRWTLIGKIDEDSAAGNSSIGRLMSVLAPYTPWEWERGAELPATS